MKRQVTGWKTIHVADITASLKSGLSRKLSNEDIGLPVIRSNNLIPGSGIDYSDIRYWYEEDPQGANTNNYLLRKDDILINFINSISSIGKCSLYDDKLGRKVIYTTNIMCLRVNERLILPQYFLYLTQTESLVVSSSFRVRTDVRICPGCGRLPNAPQRLCRNRVLRDRE
jgi:type I restriction enzyme, S subunit